MPSTLSDTTTEIAKSEPFTSGGVTMTALPSLLNEIPSSAKSPVGLPKA